MENVKDPIEAAVADKEKKGRLFLFYTFQIIVMECGTGQRQDTSALQYQFNDHPEVEEPEEDGHGIWDWG